MIDTCKSSGCQQPLELISDESQIVAYYTKNEKGVEKNYICHSYPTVKRNGYCRYHNRFVDANTPR